MTTAALSQLGPDGLPSPSVLAGLSRLHPLAFIADADGHLAWLSDRLRARCGARAEGLLGQRVSELLPHVELPEPDSLSEQDSRYARYFHIPLAGEDENEPELVDVALCRDRSDDGEDDLVIGVLRSVDRRCARRPEDAANFLVSILDNSPDAVVALDRSGFITYANKTVERYAERSVREFLDRPVIAFLPQFAKHFERIAESLASGGGEIRGEEFAVQDPERGTTWLSVSTRIIRMPDDRAAGAVCFIRDVTEQRRTRVALEHKNAELESYVNSVSHDLRSPLVSLLGFSRLLREDYGALLDETGLHFIDRIEQSGRTMEGLIQDLLELSRIGRTTEHRTLVDPRAVLLQLQAELKLQLDEQGIELRIPSSPTRVFCDRTRLYQVFSNLIGNAVKHMGDCEDPLIVVEVHEEKTAHHLTVTDSGRGIDPADHERIFEAFTSLHRSGTKRGGSTGIGLAIVKKIVETHEGRTWVESSPGSGARFHFTLPRS